MKKLIAMIGAVAMSFGLFAEPYYISFETADDCTQGEALSKDEWTVPEGATATVIERTLDYNYQASGDARRTDLFENTNDNSLKLETGSGKVVCTPGNVADGIFIDQVVKFTGYEEAPEVTDGKIAVWMTAIEADDQAETPVPGETNMYITCGTIDAMGAIKSKTINLGAYDIEATHRVTIKSLGAVTEGGVAGFIVYIDGAQVVKTDAEGIVADAQILPAFSSYNASGMLFPALEAGTVATVAYQGIGELDDVVVDEYGPEFARFVEGTVAQIDGATLKVTDETGKEIEVKDNKFQAAPGAAITLTYTADTGKFLTGGKETWTSDQIITQDNKDFTDLVKDVEALTKVAMYTKGEGEEFYAASIQEAFENDENGIITIVAEEVVLTDTLVIPDAFEIDLGGNTITLAADKTVGIDIQADGVAISGGTIASALAANVAGSKAINIPNKNVTLDDVTIDAAHYEYAIYANCDDDCVAAGDQLSWFYTDTEDKFAELNCSGVSITGNGSLFHVEGMVANLENCSAVADTNPLFGAAHQAAVYSSLNSLTTISGKGTYTHVNALQSGNLGGKIVVAEESKAVFNGNIKSFMKVGAHTELETIEDYKAQFAFNGGTYTGNIVFEDALALDVFAKAADVEITEPAGYQWNEETGILEAIPEPTIDYVKFTVSYDASKVENVTVTTNGAAVVAAESIYTVESNAVVTVAATAKDGFKNVTITGNNVTVTDGEFTADKAESDITITADAMVYAQIPEITETFTYNGEARTAIEAGEGYTVVSGATGTGAGSYTAVVALAEGYDAWSDKTTENKDIDWSIAKAAVTVTADNQTIKVGQTPATYTAQVTDGTVYGSDELDYEVACPTYEDKEGTYDIVVTPGTNPNYEVEPVNGTLTVQKAEDPLPPWVPEGEKEAYNNWKAGPGSAESDFTGTDTEIAKKMEDSFLLNCAPTEAALKTAKDNFVITSITQDADGNWVVLTVGQADQTAYGNGLIKLKAFENVGCTGTPVTPADQTQLFWKASLVHPAADSEE